MNSFNFTPSQSWTIINALHTAAKAYEEFANASGHTRLVIQYRKQAQQSLALATLIEKAL